MAQVTIYLDDELADAMRHRAKAQQISQSRWIAELIEQALENEWPTNVIALAGSWSDFPMAEELRASLGVDTVRETI